MRVVPDITFYTNSQIKIANLTYHDKTFLNDKGQVLHAYWSQTFDSV